MPTIFTHAIVALSARKLFFREKAPVQFDALAVFCSVGPDFDVIGFGLGIHYGDFLGHRGFSHSLCLAALVALGVVSFAFRDTAKFSAEWRKLVLFFFLVTASHGLLDALTDGGLGIALFAPFENGRHFLPWQPLRVSPIGAGGMFSGYFLRVLASELFWIWLPCLALVAGQNYRQRQPGN